MLNIYQHQTKLLSRQTSMVGISHNTIKPRGPTPFHPSFFLMPENLKPTHKPAVN